MSLRAKEYLQSIGLSLKTEAMAFLSGKDVESVNKTLKESDLADIINAEAQSMLNLSFDQKVRTLDRKQLFQVQMYLDIGKAVNKTKRDPILPKDEDVITFLEDDEEQSDNMFSKGKSVYKMVLTNGIEEVMALEYEHIPDLVKLLSAKKGKLIVLPSTEVRRGVLMLDAKNTNLLI